MSRHRLNITFPTRRYGGYIFDCDGTIADSMPLHHESWRYALMKHGASFEYTTALFKSLAGVGHADTVRRLNKQFGDQLDPEAVAEDKERYFESHADGIVPLDEVADWARRLHAEGARMSVASGGARTGVHRTLRAIGPFELFPVDCIVTQDDVRRGKPDPEIFLLAASRMGVDPRDCIVMEDSPLGIQGARDAGMDCLQIPATI
jgi:HAD superfamily hydrolase (TIGR01509 family)